MITRGQLQSPQEFGEQETATLTEDIAAQFLPYATNHNHTETGPAFQFPQRSQIAHSSPYTCWRLPVKNSPPLVSTQQAAHSDSCTGNASYPLATFLVLR